MHIQVDEETALGFAPRRMLELSVGPHTEPIHWHDAEFGPEQGVGSVTLEVATTDAVARYMDSEPKPGKSAECNDWIEIDVTLSVESEGGALNESVPAALVATNPYVATFDASVPFAELGGTLAFEGSGDDSPAKFDFAGVFSEYGATGLLIARSATTTECSGHTCASEMGYWLVATFPTEEPCDGGRIPTVAREDSGIDEGLELLASASGLVLRMPDDRLVGVELGAMDDGGPVCLQSSGGAVQEAGSVRTQVVLSVTTEDGTIAHDLEGFLHTTRATDGSLGEMTITASCYAYPTDEFVGLCGDWGVPLAGYDSASVEAEISVRPPADAPEIAGTFTIQGVPTCVDPEGCDDDPVDIEVVGLDRE